MSRKGSSRFGERQGWVCLRLFFGPWIRHIPVERKASAELAAEMSGGGGGGKRKNMRVYTRGRRPRRAFSTAGHNMGYRTPACFARLLCGYVPIRRTGCHGGESLYSEGDKERAPSGRKLWRDWENEWAREGQPKDI